LTTGTTSQIRYFHDDNSIEDAFQEEGVQQLPIKLLNDVGYFVLPVRRTWEATVSFASDLFRKAVTTIGGIPADTILDERNRLRSPKAPMETDDRLGPLVKRINDQMAQVMAEAPKLQLRVTSTDSESLLRALVPHYETAVGITLPAGRHGMGLLSLQTFILLLEIGRERREQGRSFILAMEEPELHLSPGIQRRLISQAMSVSNQTICMSHAPRVAAFYPATQVQFLERRENVLASTPLLAKPLGSESTASARKFYQDDRANIIEAIMQSEVLVPEGRTEYEWFTLLADTAESGDRTRAANIDQAPPFSAVIGVVLTHNGAVRETYERLRKLRSGISVIVDGDDAGVKYIQSLTSLQSPPTTIVQWPEGWTIEDAICWILEADRDAVVEALKPRMENYQFRNLAEIRGLFHVDQGPGRLKTDYLAHQEIVSVIREHEACLIRTDNLLRTITLACLRRYNESEALMINNQLSTEKTTVLRFEP
jgi:putative ATP-dependent endonuclease of the OLD family